MNEQQYTFYKHSGKFGPHGPVLAIIAALVVGYPLGILYSYLIKWIPFIYLNFFITVGYGAAYGLMTAVIMKFAKVRNGTVAAVTGLIAGLCGSFLSWNGFLHSITDDAPLFINFAQLSKIMKFFYDHGSWGIGTGGSGPVTGTVLALVWIAEAGIIVVMSTALSFVAVAHVPFCETHECWLNQEKKIESLDAFLSPDQVATLKAGSIAPLEAAGLRVPASGRFSRLLLRYSDKCEENCTLSMLNVTVSVDKNSKPRESTQTIITNLLLPKTMLDYLGKLEHREPPATAGV